MIDRTDEIGRSLSRRLFLLGAAAPLVLSLSGCRARRARGDPARTPMRDAQVRAPAERADLIRGRTAVLPVQPAGPAGPGRRVRVRIGGGPELPAGLFWISVRADLTATGAAGWAAAGASPVGGWLPPPGEWFATPSAADTRPSAEGFWGVVFDAPPEAAGTVLVGSVPVAVNWLEDPAQMPAVDPADAFRATIPSDWLDSPYLAELLGPERLSPLRRWRARTLMGELTPAAGPEFTAWESPRAINDPPRAAGVADDGSFTDPVVEAWSRQIEGRWQVAFCRLWQADPAAAAKVRQRVATAVEFVGQPGSVAADRGVAAPVWAADGPELESLMEVLLDPALGPRARAERALAWAQSQPGSAAWVIDDAGLRDAVGGAMLATCGVANLGDTPTLAWAAPEGVPRSSEVMPLPRLSARTVVSGGRDPGDEPGGLGARRPGRSPPPRAGAAPITIHAGQWSAARLAAVRAIPVRPPGLRLGPFLPDWTLRSWIRHAGTEMENAAELIDDPAWRTGALLLREDTAASGRVGADATAGEWALYVECVVGSWGLAPMPAEAGEEWVRLWFGPLARPTAVVRVSVSGVSVDEAVNDGPAPARGVSVRRQPDRWVCRVAVPARCIEGDRTLRVGMERTDSRGRRTAWPRPMMPWQTEPGRIAVDLSQWGTPGEGAGEARGP